MTVQEKTSLEGEITLDEASVALKNMKNNKSPGFDGFTVEFFKFCCCCCCCFLLFFCLFVCCCFGDRWVLSLLNH